MESSLPGSRGEFILHHVQFPKKHCCALCSFNLTFSMISCSKHYYTLIYFSIISHRIHYFTLSLFDCETLPVILCTEIHFSFSTTKTWGWQLCETVHWILFIHFELLLSAAAEGFIFPLHSDSHTLTELNDLGSTQSVFFLVSYNTSCSQFTLQQDSLLPAADDLMTLMWCSHIKTSLCLCSSFTASLDFMTTMRLLLRCSIKMWV